MTTQRELRNNDNALDTNIRLTDGNQIFRLVESREFEDYGKFFVGGLD